MEQVSVFESAVDPLALVLRHLCLSLSFKDSLFFIESFSFVDETFNDYIVKQESFTSVTIAGCRRQSFSQGINRLETQHIYLLKYIFCF